MWTLRRLWPARSSRIWPVLACLAAAFQPVVWWRFAVTPGRHPDGTLFILLELLGTMVALLVAAAVAVGPSRLWFTLLAALAALSTAVSEFAWSYWDIGTVRNWNLQLSKVDSIYVALGALTTAGTEGISAQSETARRLLTAQLAVEVMLVPILLGLIVYRASQPD